MPVISLSFILNDFPVLYQSHKWGVAASSEYLYNLCQYLGGKYPLCTPVPIPKIPYSYPYQCFSLETSPLEILVHLM